MMAAMDPIDAARIADDVFAKAPELASVPGIAYGLVHGDALVHAGGRGAATLGGPVPGPGTVFRIASMTKSFTASAVLMLRDSGLLRLDDPVIAHLPFVKTIGAPDGPPLTVRDLLTMGSGLATDDPWGDRQESLAVDEFDALVAGGLSFCRPPRMGFEYSNTGYALLGRIIEAVSEVPYRDFVVDRICAPLGMTSTRFDPREVPPDQLATGYRIAADAVPVAEPAVYPGVYSAMGGLHSTIADLALWVGGFIRSWTSSSDHPVDRWALREAQELARLVSVDDASATTPGATATGYGYGLYVQEDRVLGRVVSHSGGYPGFGSHMRWHPASGWGVILLGNATYTPAHVAAGVVLTQIVSESTVAASSVFVPSADERGLRPPIPVTPWPQTVAAMSLAEDLLDGRTGAVSGHQWASNMDLDVPREERLAGLQALREAVGAFVRDDASVEFPTPAQASWTVTGATGSVRLELMMTPERTPRIQSLVAKQAPS
jgi:CubicO group peptidase (beta-lactamase class C family)